MNNKILLVEDEALIAIDEAMVIQNHGYEVITANKGEKAIEIIDKDPSINLILMDIDLGKGIDGTEAAKIILKKHEIPIVFLTSHSEKDFVDRVKKITKYGYVLKNSGEFILIESINMAYELFHAHQKIKKEKEATKLNEKKLNELNEKLYIKNEELVNQNKEYIKLNKELHQINNELSNAKTEIQKSEERYLSLLNRIQAGVVVHKSDTKIIACNPKAQELLGQTEDQILGKVSIDPDWKFFDMDGEVFSIDDYPVNQVLSTKKPLRDFTIGIYRPNLKDKVWVLVNAIPVLDDNEEIIEVIITFMDITDRKMSNERLGKAEKLYRNLFMNAQVGIFRTDIDSGKVLEANDALAHFAGYKNREELLADDYNIADHYVNPEDRLNMIKLISENGEIQNYEAQFSRSDNSIIWIRFSAKITENKKYIEGVSEDFTTEKNAKDALNESNERLKSLTELLPEAIIETDKNFKIIYANNKAFQLMGYTKEDFQKGLYSIDMLHVEEIEYAKENFNKRITGELSGTIEYQAVKKNGEIFPVLVNADPIIKDDKFYGLRVIIIDISKRKKVQEKQEKYLKQLEFINQVIITISRMRNIDEICNYIADKIHSEYKKAIIVISLYDETIQKIRIRALTGYGKLANMIIKLTGFDPSKILIDRDKMITDIKLYTSGKLELVPEGVYSVLEGRVPKTICRQFENLSGLKDVYVIGFSLGKKPIGGITLILPEGQDVKIKYAIESIARNVSLIFDRILAEDALKESENKLQRLINNMPVMMKALDKDFNVIEWNQECVNVTGYQAEEIIMNPDSFKLLYPDEEYREKVISSLSKLEFNYRNMESIITTKTGEQKTISWSNISALINIPGWYTWTIGMDVTERKKAEYHLQKSLKEKDILMKELNHRVKNNLVIISSLIKLKNSELGNRIDLSDIHHQIDAIRLVHEKLYQTDKITHLDLKEYIQDLLNSIFSYFKSHNVLIENKIEHIEIKIKQAISIGLIINEVATNAIKYGFDNNSDIKFIANMIKDNNNQYILTLANTGKPFPEYIDLDNPNTLGLRLISSLVHQLDGSIELKKKPYPVYTIKFPMTYSND